MSYRDRFDALQQKMVQKKIDYAIILPGYNFRYMTGLNYDPLERLSFMMLGTAGDAYLFLPKLEKSRAELLSKLGINFDVFMWDDATGPGEELKKIGKVFGNKQVKLGIEFGRCTLARKNQLDGILADVILEDITEIFYELRVRKDNSEIKQLHDASRLSDEALKNVIDGLSPGITEFEISNRIKIELLKLGSEALPVEFKPIVATAANSAKPHTRSGANVLERGQVLLIDTGACMEGYAIDITRTFLIEPVPSELKKIYQTVYAANMRAIESVRRGVAPEALDRIARDVIEAAGYGRFFTHRLGHGIGLEEHEPPWIVQGNRTPLDSGMTFTIEPGIYIPEMGGVRIEDNVVVTEDGYELLTTYPKKIEDISIEL